MMLSPLANMFGLLVMLVATPAAVGLAVAKPQQIRSDSSPVFHFYLQRYKESEYRSARTLHALLAHNPAFFRRAGVSPGEEKERSKGRGGRHKLPWTPRVLPDRDSRGKKIMIGLTQAEQPPSSFSARPPRASSSTSAARSSRPTAACTSTSAPTPPRTRRSASARPRRPPRGGSRATPSSPPPRAHTADVSVSDPFPSFLPLTVYTWHLSLRERIELSGRPGGDRSLGRARI